ncbi:glycoside hydrolase family 31 protein [Phocaeicola plebeius]|uniref:glycoside hydrolase family 31 protein n=1 Tax=Phocaeicola plebeius TaxID=310297 RepID=UPI001EF4856B|nr:TIM-barrel domain-containing protein [Phocaeicola plebeius]
MMRFICTFTILFFFWFEIKAQYKNFFYKEEKKIVVNLTDGKLYFYPLTENTLRVKFVRPPFNDSLPEWIYTTHEKSVVYHVEKEKDTLSILLSGISAKINLKNGLVTFFSPEGKVILQERGRQLTPSMVQNVNTYCALQRFYSPEEEHQFGLGQFQDGYLNVKGLSRRLTQVNTQIAVPMLISDKGYGVLWNNYGLTDFNPANDTLRLVPIKGGGKIEEVEITSTEGGKKEIRENYVFASKLNVPVSGRYSIMLDVGQNMARKYHLRIGNKTIFDMSNTWLPPTTSAIVELEAGVYDVVANLEKKDSPKVFFKMVDEETVFRSPVAECVDYTVFCGDVDKIIDSYRNVTGSVPMLPDWALGYIHCRERFHSQEELLETAKKFRSSKLPVDVIVQDWQYWGQYGWNAMKFDERYYPAPGQMVNKLHEMNMRLMISVWSKVDPSSQVGEGMEKNGFFIPGTSWVDFFNPEAAKYYWENFSSRLLKYGIDAWWQDATEPENDDLFGRMVANQKIPGEVFRNIYPLLVNKTVYEGLRRDVPNKRAMILTRSAFPGMQRYATATWSGDVGYDWNTLKRQIVGGLGMVISGQPWWTYDAGGFFRPKNQYTDSIYQECLMRWIQTAVFLPLMRVHGYDTNTEFWNYGPRLTSLARRSLAIRYSLAPYIYSENANVSFRNGTLMRPLVMDFANDTVAVSQKYQYMFGPSLLVAPIVESNVKEWKVYFPAVEGGWYNFWNNVYINNNGWEMVPVRVDCIPVFVRAGSILPLAKGNPQTVKEARHGNLIIKIFAGADGAYTLYEDEGTNYNYEKGQYAKINLSWNDQKKELTIGQRIGSFPHIKLKRNFHLVKITKNSCKEQDVCYVGDEVVIRFDD